MQDVEAVVAQLLADPEVLEGGVRDSDVRGGGVRDGGLGVVGYCMGGGYALAAAGTFPERFAAAAIFHAGGLATDSPDSPHRLAPAIRARVHVGAAEIDPSFPPEQQARLGRALTEAGVTHEIEVHPGARHGFAVTGHVVYDHEASERHWTRLLQLFEAELRPAPAGTGPG
jgi:carboxymethylenebutenolidase